MSHEPSYRIEYGADETLDDPSAGSQEQRDVAELQRLFEDVTGTQELVDEQDRAGTSRDVTDESAVSTDAFDDGLAEAIDEPDVDNAL